MRSHVDLKRMRHIVEVARAETITVAAETLGLPQPALTRSIAEVEEELGIKLYHRVPRGMRLTEADQRFIARAKRILGDVEDLVTDLRTGTGEMTGRLRLGVAPGSDVLFAIRSLRALAGKHPGVKIEIVPGSAESLCPRLLSGELDAIIGASTYLQRWRELDVKPLCRLYFGCMVRKEHPITRLPDPTERDMLRYPLLMPASVDAVHSPIALRYAHHGLHLQPHYVTDNPYLLHALINSTDAFHALHHPDPEFTALVQDFTVMRDLVEMPDRYFCIAWSSLHPRTEIAAAFEAQLDADFLAPDSKYRVARVAAGVATDNHRIGR